MEDVLDLPNSSMRKITSIRISTPYVYSPVHASIRLSDNSYLPVSYDLSGEERHVIPLAYSLDDHLLSLRQWYSFLTRYSFIGVFAVVYLAVFVLANLAVASDFLFPSLLPGEASSDSETDPGLQAAFWAVIVLVIGAILGLDWVRTKAFPIGTFAIGQGIARHKRLNYLRGIFLTGIALPILTGLIVAAVP
jgi:hypothetical protein